MLRKLNTKEEEVMTILWKIKKGYIKDIIAEFPSPKPHYNTISSIVRKLENEGHVGHTIHKRSHQYFPLASKKAYRAALFDHLYSTYFGGSKKKFLKYSMEKIAVKKSDLKKIFMF